ncbi:HIT domain-containing protein [Candidatus Pacearchaeota archaeon]|nr:HIT domain-containing protein [Candidatus Pacearchaeota archaeon]
MSEDCIFCKIANGVLNRHDSCEPEIPSEKVYENENFFSIFDIAPQVEGHVVVISKKHFKTLLDMPNSLGPEFLDCVKKTSLKLIEKFNADGFNVVNNTFECAGQVVDHFHVHILPRKKDDGYFLSLGKK